MALGEYYRRHLPHFQPAGATFHIVFRLAGTLPRSIIHKLQREAVRNTHPLPDSCALTDAEHDLEKQRRYFWQLEQTLDTAAYGPTWLLDHRAAGIVHEAIMHRDGDQYALSASTIMPNHVHLVCAPVDDESGQYSVLSDILGSLKGYTARKVNIVLGRHGKFWQDESFDRVIRDFDEYRRTVGYVVNNPVKTGLVSMAEDWPWTYVSDSARG